MIRSVYWSACKVTVVSVNFNEDFLYKFSKNTQISNFTKTHSVGAELLRADGQL
jgi:hypothetical protein